MVGLLAGCGGGSSSHPKGYFGHFPAPDDTDLPRDAIFAVLAPEFAVDRMRLYRWRDRDDDLHAYGDEMTRVSAKRYYDVGAGEHVLVPGNYLQTFARYLLVVDYSDGVRSIWAFESGDWISGRSTEDGPRRWSVPAEDAQPAETPTKKSWTAQ
jgi:hypothetical protein